MSPLDPAGNAVKHGLSSKTSLPQHAHETIRLMELELTELHQPESDLETNAVKTLAVALWQKHEQDRLHALRVDHEILIADQLFDHQQNQKFLENHALLIKNPLFARDILAQTYLGAKFFHKIWTDIAESIGPNGSGMTLSQAWNAALSEQSSPNVQDIDTDGWWIFARFIAASPAPKEEIDEWLDRSGAKKSKTAARHAMFHWENAPNAGDAKADLLIRANDRKSYWAKRVDELAPIYQRDKQSFRSTASGQGLGDQKLMTEARLGLRYGTAAQRLVEKLERRLQALKSGRQLERHRRLQALERDQRREERLNQRKYSLKGLEAWEADQTVLNGPIPSAYEATQRQEFGVICHEETSENTPQDCELAEPVQASEISPQTVSLQSYISLVQNGLIDDSMDDLATREMLQSWPDSDFLDPRIPKARAALIMIQDREQAEYFINCFTLEKRTRLSKLAIQEKESDQVLQHAT